MTNYFHVLHDEQRAVGLGLEAFTHECILFGPSFLLHQWPLLLMLNEEEDGDEGETEEEAAGRRGWRS